MVRNRRGVSGRPAFTLIEMMIVVAIIAVLAGLLGAAVMKLIPVQVRKNTENTIRKTNALLQRNWKAVIDQAASEARGTLPVTSAMLTNITNLAGGDMDRRKVIWTKLRLKQQFPRSYYEAVYPDNNLGYISAEPTYYNLLKNMPSVATPSKADSTEMGACLLLALTAVKRSGVNIDADTLNSLEARDTNGDGLLELVDGWGTALGFYRWTFGNLPTDVTKAYSTYTFQDPEDPLGRLQASAWATLQSTTFNNVFGYTPSTKNFYTMPVIVSAGPDRQLGYSDTFLTSGGTATYDNILSYDLK